MTGASAVDIGLMAGDGSLLAPLRALFVRRPLRAVDVAKPAVHDPHNNLLMDAEHRIGGALLAASDADDLDDRLDAVLRDGAIFHLNALASRDFDPAQLRAVSTRDVEVKIGKFLWSLSIGDRIAVAPGLAVWVTALITALDGFVGLHGIAALCRQADQLTPDLLSSPELPPELAQALADQLRLVALLLALGQARRQKLKLYGWQGPALAARIRTATLSHLSVLASVPGVVIPTELLPVGQRLDLDAVIRRHARVQEQVRAMVERLP